MLILGINIKSSISANDEPYPTDLEFAIHDKINEERSKNGLQELFFHSKLLEVARLHSQDMLDNNYFNHTSQDNKGPGDRLTEAGIEWTVYAENLATIPEISESKIPDESLRLWMDSEGHKANILRENVEYTGVGIAFEGTKYLITQVFINASENHLIDIGSFFNYNPTVSGFSSSISGRDNTELSFEINGLTILTFFLFMVVKKVKKK